MASSLYTPLPADNFSIRLIKLQPSDDISTPILCKLVIYAIDSDRPGAHSYECLSYVWGTEKHGKLIQIDTGEAVVSFQATPNLHQALIHLRDPVFEQILWIDAICIDQKNDEEKATQVAAMARIYGLAKRVVVWLGAEADQSTFALERLRNLAQSSQLIEQSRPSGNTSSDGPDAHQAIRSLLNRPYFRRMWVLQEVTAARNMLFKCGDAEMQTATFLAGLDALKHLDNWELRNRILAFLLLVKTSTFRESLKGRAHLDIEPLNELIDRFHAHDASDPRDKIYALWGLCSDSSMMTHLRPDYTKKWQCLLEDLGKFTFGEDSVVSASFDRQIMFVRTTGNILGRVEEIPELVARPLWEDNLKLRVTSLRATTPLSYTSLWSVCIKVRAPAEQILEGDHVLFIPHMSKIVIARPIRYYLRIVMIIDSPLVEVGDYNDSVHWKSWHPFLLGTDYDVNFLPLVWSWEKHDQQEEEDSLTLMGSHNIPVSSETNVVRAQALRQAEALSGMAVLFIEYKDYNLASSLLAYMVNIYASIHGEKSEVAVASRDRLNSALIRKANYLKAKDLLVQSQVASSSYEFIVDCAKTTLLKILGRGGKVVMLEGFMHWTMYSEETYSKANALVLSELVAKELSEGVSREDMIQALEQCEVQDFAVNRTSGKSTEEETYGGVEQHNNYLQFLVDLAKDDISISETELVAAAGRKISDTLFIQLAKRIENPLQNLPELLEALISRRYPGLIVQDLVTALGDRIVVTPNAINVAAKWDADALSALLKTAKDTPVVTPAAFTIALKILKKSTYAIVRLLVQHAEIGLVIPEEAIICLIRMSTLRIHESQVRWVFIALIERTDLVVDISENALVDAMMTVRTLVKAGILALLQFRPTLHFHGYFANDVFIKNEHYVKALSQSKILMDCIADLQKNSGPFRQENIDTISAHDIAGYASFINLVRYRKSEFEITENLILRVVNTKKKDAEKSSWLYGEDEAPWESLLVIDKCTAFLITHANNGVIRALVRRSAFIDTAVSRGFPHVIEALQAYSYNTILNLDTLYIVAELCHMLQRPVQPGESFAHIPKIQGLIQKLAGMEHESVSRDVKFKMFLHARYGQYGTIVVDTLLENGILNAEVINAWKNQSLDTEAGHQEV